MEWREGAVEGPTLPQKPSDCRKSPPAPPGLSLGLEAVSPAHLVAQGLQGPGSRHTLQRPGLVQKVAPLEPESLDPWVVWGKSQSYCEYRVP